MIKNIIAIIIASMIILGNTNKTADSAGFAIFQVYRSNSNFLLDGTGGFLLDGSSGKLIAQ